MNKGTEKVFVVHKGGQFERTYPYSAVERFWEKGDLSYLVHPYQMDLYDKIWSIINSKDNWFGVINCSRQFGKTFVTTLVFMEAALRFHRYDIHFLAENRATLRSRIFKCTRIIMDSCPWKTKDKRPFVAGSGKDRGVDEMVFPTSESTISFFGIKDTNYRGASANLVNVDEAGFIDNLKNLVVREIEPSFTQTKGKLILTSTPPPSNDHYYLELVEQARVNNQLATFTIYDNTLVTPQDIESKRTRALQDDGTLSNDFRREHLAELIPDDDLRILPSWQDRYILTNEQLASYVDDKFHLYHKFISIDYGVVDYTVIAFYFYHKPSDLLIKQQSLWMKGNQVSIGSIASELQREKLLLWKMDAKTFPTLIVCDSGDKMATQSLVADYGIPAVGVSKSRDKGSMVTAFNDFIKEGRFRINEKLQMDIGCYNSGIWKDGLKRGKEFRRSDLYGHYDAIDGDVYLLKSARSFFDQNIVHNEHFDINKQMAPLHIMDKHLKRHGPRSLSETIDAVVNNNFW